MQIVQVAAVGLGCLAASVSAAAAKVKCSECSKTITRDVVVVGGGASGAHAAVWLRDNGQSVVVVEKASQLVSVSPGFHPDAPFPVSVC